MLGVVVRAGENIDQPFVGRVAYADRLEQHRHRNLALAIDLDGKDVALGGLEFQPRAAIRDQFGGAEDAAGRAVFGRAEIDARRTDQLRHDDALGAIDDEGAVFGHQWKVAHVDFLGGCLAGLVVDERDLEVEGRGEGHVHFAAFRLGILGVAKMISQAEFARDVIVAGEEEAVFLVEGFDRRDLVEKLAQAFGLEPFERLDLNLDQCGNVVDIGDTGVRLLIGHQAIDHRRHRQLTHSTSPHHDRLSHAGRADCGQVKQQGAAH